MALEPSAPIPVQDAIAQPIRPQFRAGGIFEGQPDPFEGMCSTTWTKFFNNQSDQVNAGSPRLTTTELTAQAASISTTALDIGTVPAGLYRATHYMRVTRAASTSSSLLIIYTWTDTVSMSSNTPIVVFAAITNNTTATYQSGSQMFYIDNASPISYATTYASVGGTSMQYSLRITVERVDA